MTESAGDFWVRSTKPLTVGRVAALVVALYTLLLGCAVMVNGAGVIVKVPFVYVTPGEGLGVSPEQVIG